MSKRPYTLKRRAEQQAETRQRIVDATVALHSSVGPAQTSLSMIAERAGVQRHTLYSHFPDERSLFMACSGEAAERFPLPSPEPWPDIPDTGDRLRTGIRAIYDWYDRNAKMAACILRDSEHHALTREVSELRMGPTIQAWHAVLGEGLAPSQRAMLALMLGFYSWRTLTRDCGLDRQAATALAAQAILGAA